MATKVDVQFAPGMVSEDRGDGTPPKVRGVFVCIPEESVSTNWAQASKILCSSVAVEIDVPGVGSKRLSDVTPSASWEPVVQDVAEEIWNTIVDAGKSNPFIDKLQAFNANRNAQLAPDSTPWQRLRLPREVRDDQFFADPSDEMPGDVLPTGLGVMERSLVALHTLRAMGRARGDEDGGGLISSIVAPLFWQHSEDVQRVAPPPQDRAETSIEVEERQRRKNQLDRAKEIAAAVQTRGIEDSVAQSRQQNRQLGLDGGNQIDDEIGPFHRELADPGPRQVPSNLLVKTVWDLVGEWDEHAQQSYRDSATGNGLSGSKNPALKWAGEIAGAAQTAAVQGLDVVDRQADFVTVLGDRDDEARKLLALLQTGLRPDHKDRLDFEEGQAFKNLADDFNLTKDELHLALQEAEKPVSRLLGGLMGVSPIARVARLVFDIDIDLDDGEIPQAMRDKIAEGKPFTIKVIPVGNAEFAPESAPTNCLVTRTMGDSGSRIFVPIDDSRKAGYSIRNGMLDVSNNVTTDPAQGRYSMSSVDLAGFAARTWNEGESEAERISSGEPPDEEASMLRSSGIAFYDASSDKIPQSIINSVNDPNVRSAHEITTGFMVDVGVTSRKSGMVANENSQPPDTWRSLCERILKYPRDGAGAISGVGAAVKATMNEASKGIPMGPDQLESMLSATLVRTASRIVSETPTHQQGISMDLLFEWSNDPMGAACIRSGGEEYTNAGGESDGGIRSLVEFQEDLAVTGTRPPRMEFQRKFNFGMRAVYLGGYAHPLSIAEEIYAGDGAGGNFHLSHVHRRMENVAPPDIFMPPGAGEERGETLTCMAVRSPRRSDISRRIVAVPPIPMESAVTHPTVDTARNRGTSAAGFRVLDRRVVVGLSGKEFPAGGWPNVTSMPSKLQAEADNRPDNPDTVFRVGPVSKTAFCERAEQYYPDPMVDKIVFELIDPVDGTAVTSHECDVYDGRYFQSVPSYIHPSGHDYCTYPNAIPVLVELNRTSRDSVSTIDEIGYLDERGRFTPLRPGRRPPPETMTMRRLTVRLPRGYDLDVKATCKRHEAYRDGFGPAAKAVEAIDGLKLNVTLAQYIGAKDDLQYGCDQLEMRVVHAVQRPEKPFVPNILALPGPSQMANPVTLRRTIDDADWPRQARSLMAEEVRESNNELGATSAWLGGAFRVDRRVTGKVSFRVEYRDLKYDPLRPPETVDGVPVLEPKALESIELALERVPAKGADGEGNISNSKQGAFDPARHRQVDFVEQGLLDKPSVAKLDDTRAYEIELTPVAVSRFGDFFDPEYNQREFGQTGNTTSFWTKSTKRPASLAFVEMLPAFVWEEQGSGNAIGRRMVVRLMWKNRYDNNPENISERDKQAAWPSSGKNEKLAILLRRGNDLAGSLEQMVSRIGSDAIRTGAEPGDDIEMEDLFGFASAVDEYRNPAKKVTDIFVPNPGTADSSDAAIPKTEGAQLDILPFTPKYEERENYWFVDLDLGNPDNLDGVALGAPWLRIGLARYQEHALYQEEDQSKGRPFRDLRVSQPTVQEFRLEPSRKVLVNAYRSDAEPGYRYVVHVTVFGDREELAPFTNADGSQPANQDLGTNFKLTALRRPFSIADSFAEGGEEIVDIKTSPPETDLPPGILWRQKLYFSRNPTRSRHYIFVEELESMLSADATTQCPTLTKTSGPRFMAKVLIRSG